MKSIHISNCLMTASFCIAAVCSCSIDQPEFPHLDFRFNLTAKVDGMDDLQTKATLLNSSSDITDKTLKLYAWENDNYWIQGQDVTYSSGKWNVSGNLNSSNNYVFLSYANLPGSGVGVTTPTAKDGDITLTVADITAAQNDILLGSGEVNTPTSGNVTINYIHPFASVRFKLGNAYEVTSGVKAISLSGVYASGKTTYNKDTDSFTWTNLGKANATITASGLNVSEGQEIATFVVIPQSLVSKNAVVTVTYDSGSKMTRQLSDGSWTAGSTTIYTLDKIGDISASVSGGAITNNGQSKIYVRATITGAWYDAVGNVIAPWSDSDGYFSGLGSGWTKDGDIYYIDNGIAKDGTANLFSSYTRTATPPETGAILKLDVLVQAIPHNVNKTCREAFAAL